MIDSVYLAIIERLRAARLGIKHYSLWNNNTADLSREGAWQPPAVFVEFMPIVWEQYSRGARSGEALIRLHIITNTLGTPQDGGRYQQQALRRFRLTADIDAALQGMCGPGFNALMLVESSPDHNHSSLYHDVETFKTRITDCSARKKPDTTLSPTPVIKASFK